MADSLVFALSEFLQLLDVDFRLKGIVKSKIDELRKELRQWELGLKESGAGSINYEDIRQISGDITEISHGVGDKLIYIAEADGGKFKKFIYYVRAARYFDGIFRPIRDMRRDYSLVTSVHRHDPSAAEDVRSGDVTAYVAREFVERVKEREQLLSYLVEESERCQVIAISGMGGAGKTKLAQHLLEHPLVKIHYRGRPLVPVSRKFQRKKIFTEILEKLDQPPGENDSEEDLAKSISKYLNKYKRLIVLDDIWSLDDWESLRVILPKSFKSKILFTTRQKQVAENANRGLARCVHIERLTLEEGCELLKKKVPDLKMEEDLEKKIVNFCGGLPLTIVSFLRSMVGNYPLVEWEEIVSQGLNCASNRRLELPEVRTTLEVLAASIYDDLPYILKLFFLYMGVLQEDLRIEVEKLYLLWLAERLISLKPLQRGERLLDIAQSYVTELAERGLVDLDEEEVPAITRFKYVQLTEIMRDLSLFKNKEECFLKVVEFGDGSQPMPDSFSSLPGPRTCRVAINFDEYKEGYGFPLEDDEKMHIRVLLFSDKKKQVWPRKFSSLAKFKYLKVLIFNGFNFELTILPHVIATAAFLRYLSFEDCMLRELPSSIGNLKFLYILDLRVQNTMIIPNVLWKLKKLRHLYFPLLFKTPDGTKLKLKGLIGLETITNYNPKMCNVEDLFGLPNLQYLASTIDGNLEEVESIIRHMTRKPDVDLLRTSIEIKNFDCYTEERHSVFRELLACESLRILRMEGHLCRTPPYHRFSQNLIKIEFIGSALIEDPMKTLEKLPKLRELVLDDAFVGEEIVCSASGFVELKLLRLLNLPDLKNWVVKDGAMPKLSTLAIAKCRQLEMLPEGLQYVRGVREFKVSGMSEDFKNRITTGEDSFKVQHMPPIIFED